MSRNSGYLMAQSNSRRKLWEKEVWGVCGIDCSIKLGRSPMCMKTQGTCVAVWAKGVDAVIFIKRESQKEQASSWVNFFFKKWGLSQYRACLACMRTRIQNHEPWKKRGMKVGAHNLNAREGETGGFLDKEGDLGLSNNAPWGPLVSICTGTCTHCAHT